MTPPRRSPYTVEIADEQTLLDLDPKRLIAVVRDVLAAEGVIAAEISVALIDGAAMRQLNARHLDHDYDTDVLSFLLEESAAETEPLAAETPAGTDRPRGAGKTLDGEVVISTTVAAAVAAEFDWSAGDEVLLYLVHGLLHLAGHDDQTEQERELMRRRERVHLARWGLSPRYAAGGTADPEPCGPADDLPAGNPPSGVRG